MRGQAIIRLARSLAQVGHWKTRAEVIINLPYRGLVSGSVSDDLTAFSYIQPRRLPVQKGPPEAHLKPHSTPYPPTMATVTVIYPKGANFDMDYYKTTHMPLAMKHWGPHGMKSWRVTQMGEDAPFCVQATLEFDSMEDVGKATSSEETKTVMDDVKNFTDSQPSILAGPVVASS